MNRTTIRIAAAAAASLLLALPAWSGEILHLKSGTAMPIVSHEIKGEMIHVDLGEGASMAFPKSMVDSIEKAGRNVLLEHKYASPSNVMSGSKSASAAVVRPGAKREVRGTDPKVDIDPKTGMAIYRPYGRSTAANRRRIGVWGNQSVLRKGRGEAFSRIGNKYLVPGSDKAEAPPKTGRRIRPSIEGGVATLKKTDPAAAAKPTLSTDPASTPTPAGESGEGDGGDRR